MASPRSQECPVHPLTGVGSIEPMRTSTKTMAEDSESDQVLHPGFHGIRRDAALRLFRVEADCRDVEDDVNDLRAPRSTSAPATRT
jgi:hypothetical protein